jgi:hypothetical protein
MDILSRIGSRIFATLNIKIHVQKLQIATAWQYQVLVNAVIEFRIFTFSPLPGEIPEELFVDLVKVCRWARINTGRDFV